MAASLTNLLDDLEARLERTQAELQTLREENQRLKQQLALQGTQEQGAQEQAAQESSVPSQERATIAETHSETAPEPVAPEHEAPEGEVLEQAAPEEIEARDQAVHDQETHDQETIEKPEPEAPAQQAKESEHREQDAPSEIAEAGHTAAPAQVPSPHALLNQWYERYPQAFFKGHTKPLKVGIHQDLAEREEWPSKLIRRALANYVNLPRYIKAVRAGAERVDLDGQPAGKVDKEAAQHASEKRGDKKEHGDKKESVQPKKLSQN